MLHRIEFGAHVRGPQFGLLGAGDFNGFDCVFYPPFNAKTVHETKNPAEKV